MGSEVERYDPTLGDLANIPPEVLQRPVIDPATVQSVEQYTQEPDGSRTGTIVTFREPQ